jgi:hypothetical protein
MWNAEPGFPLGFSSAYLHSVFGFYPEKPLSLPIASIAMLENMESGSQ